DDHGIRITVRDRADDDVIVETLARLLERPSPVAESAGRSVRHLRATAETRISVRLGLDGASRVSVQTGAGIYDHFLEQLAFHAGLDLVVEGAGDLETGDHHTVEDTALAFGEALDRALGDRRGIARYGDAVVPMDDALARAAVAGADLAVLPGVGAARSAMGELERQGLAEVLRDRVARQKPVLGICLGLQLAVDWSEEDGGVDGLGLLPGKAVRLREGRVPR